MKNTSKKKKASYGFLILLIVLFAGFTVYKLFKNQAEVKNKVYKKDPNEAMLVTAYTVKSQTVNFESQYLGTFKANREVSLASEVPGKVIQVGIEEGSQIGRGDLIVSLDTEMNSMRLAGLQAQLKDAQTNAQRLSNALRESNAVTQQQVDGAQTQVKVLQSQIAQIAKNNGQSRITAPFSGVITYKQVELGSVVNPGVPLATLTDVSTLKLLVAVPENDLPSFHKGQKIDIVTTVYPDEIFTGTVDLIPDVADASHQYLVQILVNNGNRKLKSGMYGSVVINESNGEESVMMPRSALLGSAKQPQVYVIQNGRAILRDIQLGKSSADYLEVTHGLNKGETIVTSGQINLTNNTKVKY